LMKFLWFGWRVWRELRLLLVRALLEPLQRSAKFRHCCRWNCWGFESRS
jgi:hypothetical protein